MFGAIAGPVAVWRLPAGAERFLLVAGASVGSVLAVLRVVHVLWRYAGARPRRPLSPPPPARPGARGLLGMPERASCPRLEWR
ncbi:DUF6332 family protein [Streptomyces atriruber]|uniref:DUF6332 family protein n=1 Tax=Streptomyces atriruber TaxID=545121 RepID=UPI003F541697